MITEFLSTFFSAHLPVLPVLLPLFTAVVLLLLGDGIGSTRPGHNLQAQPTL
ncbi:MAG: hypothetical protein ACI9LD_001795, partial [Polaromonas sp.]